MADPTVAFAAAKNPRTGLIESSTQLRRALELTGHVIPLRDAEKIWHNQNSQGISLDEFLKAVRDTPTVSKSDFLSAVKEIVVPAEAESEISIAELKEILSTGTHGLSATEIDDFLALQPNQEHFNLEQFWTEYEEILEKCSEIQEKDLVQNRSDSSHNSVFEVFKDKKDRYQKSTRGCLIYENPDQIHGHQFELELSEDTDLTVSIQAASLPVMTAGIDPQHNDVDIDVFLVREIDRNVQHRRLTAFSSAVDRQRRFGFEQRVAKGRYTLIPFTTGAWFHQVHATRNQLNARDNELLYSRRGSVTELSQKYLNALEALFAMVDLDGNGSIDRREFEIFASRTTGDVVQDDDWKIVTASFPTENGQLNRSGFLQLHRMEANDSSEGNIRDLWMTLESMGFDSDLHLSKAILYNMYIGSTTCSPSLHVTEIRPSNPVTEKCIARAAMERGDPEFLEADIVLHKISNGSRFSLILQNLGHQEQIVECELKEAENCIANRPFPIHVRLAAKKSAVMAHFVPRDAKRPWKINTTELVK